MCYCTARLLIPLCSTFGCFTASPQSEPEQRISTRPGVIFSQRQEGKGFYQYKALEGRAAGQGAAGEFSGVAKRCRFVRFGTFFFQEQRMTGVGR